MMDDYFETHDVDDLQEFSDNEAIEDARSDMESAQQEADMESAQQEERDRIAAKHQLVGREAEVDSGSYYLTRGTILRWCEYSKTCDIETTKLVIDGKRRGSTPGLRVYNLDTESVSVKVPKLNEDSDPQDVMWYLCDTHGADIIAKLALSALHLEETVRDAAGQDNHLAVAEVLCRTFDRTWKL